MTTTDSSFATSQVSDPLENYKATERAVDAKPSILRTRLVPSKIIRRLKPSETAKENKVEQATVRSSAIRYAKEGIL